MKSTLSTETSIESRQEEIDRLKHSLLEKVGEYIASGQGAELLEEFKDRKEKAKWVLDFARENPNEFSTQYPTGALSIQLYNAYVLLRSDINFRQAVKEM